MKNTNWRHYALALAVSGALIGSASPALATVFSDTTGSRVEGHSSGNVVVSDTQCDGDPAYARFIENGESDEQRYTNSNGCGTTYTRDFGGAITSVKACRDRELQVDNCGGWNEWTS
ncbi:hypothetical protein [Promicromonospora sp. NPDC057488]|uniref:hypothetical protein n=1 Tax=Promicromonospora sp. NPDC057488 TaxID=3346147 RepID=UPI00366B22BC